MEEDKWVKRGRVRSKGRKGRGGFEWMEREGKRRVEEGERTEGEGRGCVGMEEREEREYSFVQLVYYNCNVLFRRRMFGALIF